jgi:hypothetical protein
MDMLKIFAKHGTDEKVLAACPQEAVDNMINSLSEKYGGNWLWVDKLHLYSEVLHFKDELIYKGFHGRDERYCNAIDCFKK